MARKPHLHISACCAGWAECEAAPGGSVGDIGTEAALVVPAANILTLAGQRCVLPFVDHNSTIVNSCLDLGAGVPECLAEDGSIQVGRSAAPLLPWGVLLLQRCTVLACAHER